MANLCFPFAYFDSIWSPSHNRELNTVNGRTTRAIRTEMVPIECISLDNINANVCDIDIRRYRRTHRHCTVHTMHLHIATDITELVSKWEAHYNAIINVFSLCVFAYIGICICCECRLNAFCLFISISNHLHQLVLSAIGFSICSTNHVILLPMRYSLCI